MKNCSALVVLDQLVHRGPCGRLPGQFDVSTLSVVVRLLSSHGVQQIDILNRSGQPLDCPEVLASPFIGRIWNGPAVGDTERSYRWLLFDPVAVEPETVARIRDHSDATYLYNRNGEWTGWMAWAQAQPVLHAEALDRLARGHRPSACTPLRADTAAFRTPWVAAHRLERAREALMDGETYLMPPCWTELAPGVYASRGTSIHPSARVTGPVFLGENVRIEKGAVVAGGSVIGRNSVVGTDATVFGSVIESHTWVERGADLAFAHVDGDEAWNVASGAAVSRRIGGGPRPTPTSRLRAGLSAVFGVTSAAAVSPAVVPLELKEAA